MSPFDGIEAETPAELVDELREIAERYREQGLNADYHAIRDCAAALEEVLDDG